MLNSLGDENCQMNHVENVEGYYWILQCVQNVGHHFNIFVEYVEQKL